MFRFMSDARHGPLPALLVLLTMSTGLIDAVTFLRLGHVFVANMTGNVVFLAFALGGSTEFSVPASLTALTFFLAGALMGGHLSHRLGINRGRHLAITCAIQVIFVTGALALSLWAVWFNPSGLGRQSGDAMIALLAVAMGSQNATSRSLGVPGLTTTVMTMTLTGIAADWRHGAGANAGPPLRPLGVGVLFVGAAIGAVLVLNNDISRALGLAVGLMGATGIAAFYLSRGTPSWCLPTSAGAP